MNFGGTQTLNPQCSLICVSAYRMFGARLGPVGEYKTQSLFSDRLITKLERKKVVHLYHRQRHNFVVGSDVLPFF